MRGPVIVVLLSIASSSGCFRLFEEYQVIEADGSASDGGNDSASDDGWEGYDSSDGSALSDADGGTVSVDADADDALDAWDGASSDADRDSDGWFDADGRVDADFDGSVDADFDGLVDVDADDPVWDADVQFVEGGNVAIGGAHTCAILETGDIRCWGQGLYGRLGYGDENDIGDDELPSEIGTVSVGGEVTQVAAGDRHTCALFKTADLRCWGYAVLGPLGYGDEETIGDDEVPSSVGTVDVGGSVVKLAAGFSHTCALHDTLDMRCWGHGSQGQLGYGNSRSIGDKQVPSVVGTIEVGGEVDQIATGWFHTCAVLTTGDMRCWGSSNQGQLGYGDTNTIGDDELPTAVGTISVGGKVAQVAAGGYHTCALLEGANLRCWGAGWTGVLGYGNLNSIGDDELPSSVGTLSVGGPVMQVTAGVSHTCALLSSGSLRCWGLGGDGQLGYGNTNDIGDDELPSSLGTVSVGGPVSFVEAGGSSTCAVLESGDLRCWGLGVFGQLGYGNENNIGDDELPSEAGAVSYR